MLLFFVGPYFYAWMTIMSICGTIIMMSIAAAAADNKMLLSSSHGDMRQVLHYHLIAYFYQLPKSNNAMSDNISNINHLAIAINTLPSIIIIAARYGSLYLIDSQQPQWSQKLVIKAT